MSIGSQNLNKVQQLSDNHAMLRIDVNSRYLLLPVEEKESNAHIRVLKDGNLIQEFNCRLAVDKMDYYVPLKLKKEKGSEILLDISFIGNRRFIGSLKDFVCWTLIKESDIFDSGNTERFRPIYHHTPVYGWMNDPNGMFYKDGVWHLYFQHNPYGSQWGNMTWGHSTSNDLIHWKFQGDAIYPDALGTVFSGSAIVDKNNTAGFGRDAIVAMYTSAGINQTQSIAYSIDGGNSFIKYVKNPVITEDISDFRDPHLFWYEPTQSWIVILTAGQEMHFYSSKNLKDWKFESSFGQEYGNHSGVWECPDLIQLPVKDTKKSKWVLISNINPGGPFGGSATQYFVGSFDGHKFTCDSKPNVTKWMDYGKDHYAMVTFSNAPDNRHIAMAWMSNWQYGNVVPTCQYRSANTLPRELGLFKDGKEFYVSVRPAKEIFFAIGKKTDKLSNVCEMVVDLSGDAKVSLSNTKGEQIILSYSKEKQTVGVDRTKSGDISFSNAFPAITIAPTHGKVKQLQIFLDKSSIEVFDKDGKFSLTNLVFPSEPYTHIVVEGKAKISIYNLRR
jgi:levanase/fructan beta-fructosidase